MVVMVSLTVLILGGCARMELTSADLKNQVQINPAAEGQKVKKSFKEKRWNHYFLFQTVPTSKQPISEMIAPHVEEGDEVVGLKVSKRYTFVNGLICSLVGFIYCPDTVTVEGQVVSRQK